MTLKVALGLLEIFLIFLKFGFNLVKAKKL